MQAAELLRCECVRRALPEERHSTQWNAAVQQLTWAAQSGIAMDIHRATLAIELASFYRKGAA